VAIAECVKCWERGTYDIAICINPRQRKLKFCDTRVQAVDNLTKGAGFEFVVSVKEQDKRRLRFFKTEQTREPWAAFRS
jgi:hypothetical protein